MCPLVSFLFHTEISVCPRVGKQAQESSRGALVMRVLFSIHLPIPNSSACFAENKKDSSLGGAVNCGGFFVALGRSQCFTPQILAELPPLHTGKDGCDHSVVPSVCFPGVA